MGDGKMVHMVTMLDENIDPVEVNLAADIDNEFADSSVGAGSETVLPVRYVDTECIDIPEIVDVHGRLSDAVEALEEATGLSVIPLEMAKIAPEVTELARHEIFELNHVRYAMSHKIREHVITEFIDKIVQSLSTGLPYTEDITAAVEYKGIMYNTFKLSKDEWNLLLSKFRNYRQALVTDNVSQIVLNIFAERVQRHG